MSFKISYSSDRAAGIYSRDTAAEALAVAQELVERGGKVAIEDRNGMSFGPERFGTFMILWNKPTP
jgi:hypothetical protein